MLKTVKTRLHQAREWLMDYAYLVTLGAMIAVIAGTALYTDHLRSQQNVQAAAPAPEEPKPETGKGITTGNVNFREGPGTSYPSFGTLKKDLELTLHALTDGWYRVSVGERTGYVSSKYINVTVALPEKESSDKEETPELTVPDILGLGQTTAKVNFREQASSSSKKLDQIRSGETVTLYSLSYGWYAAEYNCTR